MNSKDELKKIRINNILNGAKTRKRIMEEAHNNTDELMKLENKDLTLLQIKNTNFNYAIKDYSEDYIQCKLCGKTLRQIAEHLIFEHRIYSELYISLFGKIKLACDKLNSKHSDSLKIKTRSIRIDCDLIDIEREQEFLKNRTFQFKKAIERDKICQECDCNETVHDVHHIIPQRLFKRYDHEQDQLDNLILLCKHCHSVYGQKLDDIILSCFEIFIKIMFPVTHKYIILYLKSQEKQILKKKSGSHKRYNYSLELIERFKENKKVNIRKASKELCAPEYVLKTFCRENNIAFFQHSNDGKQVQTKFCPACKWCGNFKFTCHLLKCTDETHMNFINEFKQIYEQLASIQKVADYYSKYNFTKAIVKDLVKKFNLKRIKIKNVNLYKHNKKKEEQIMKQYAFSEPNQVSNIVKIKDTKTSKTYIFKCPICHNEFARINKHLHDMIKEHNNDHIEFCEKMTNLYDTGNYSMKQVARTLNIDEEIVFLFLNS